MSTRRDSTSTETPFLLCRVFSFSLSRIVLCASVHDRVAGGERDSHHAELAVAVIVIRNHCALQAGAILKRVKGEGVPDEGSTTRELTRIEDTWGATFELSV